MPRHAVQDLMQFADRYKWYEAKFAADDMPDWTPGQFVSMEQEAPGLWYDTRNLGTSPK